jgi:hypothetical protein
VTGLPFIWLLLEIGKQVNDGPVTYFHLATLASLRFRGGFYSKQMDELRAIAPAMERYGAAGE